MIDYQSFINSKKHSANKYGITPKYVPGVLFDYQEHIARYAIEKGRCAGFVDTGLGKTLIELVTAQNYTQYTNKPTLIITPLAVAFQFITESKKFDICDIEYSKDGKHSSDVVVCNYERLDKFEPSDFGCVILDESSILKNFKGAIKNKINLFIKRATYRYLFTATPSPNDFIELGTSSEALGYMGYTDMLIRFFTNNEDTISPQKIGVQWVLKGHAEKSFFDWVSTWAISMRKPSDLGYSDENTKLPQLIENKHEVISDKTLCINNQEQLFAKTAVTLGEIREEQKNTIVQRCEKAVSLTERHDTSVYWCNLNDESDLIDEIDTEAVQIKGGMCLDKKEDILIAFANGDIKKLITKPKMTSFGLNWQHCCHTTYFPSFSYEQYYQAIRRFYRFGQKNPVTVDLITSDGQHRIMDSMAAKAAKANELFSRLNDAINNNYKEDCIKSMNKQQSRGF